MSLTIIKRGAPETWTFDLGYDITGHTIRLLIKSNSADDDASAVYSKDITTHSDPTNGVTTFDQTGIETYDIPKGTYIWAVKDFNELGVPVYESPTGYVEYINPVIKATTV